VPDGVAATAVAPTTVQSKEMRETAVEKWETAASRTVPLEVVVAGWGPAVRVMR
jgi:hypothetical protein